MLVDGVISPVEVLMVRPDAELYVPPVLPVWVTLWALVVVQKGELG